MNTVIFTIFMGAGDTVCLEPSIEAAWHKFFPCQLFVRSYNYCNPVYAGHPFVKNHCRFYDDAWYRMWPSVPGIAPVQVVTEDTPFGGFTIPANSSVHHFEFSNAISMHALIPESIAFTAKLNLFRQEPLFLHREIPPEKRKKIVVQLRKGAHDSSRNLSLEQFPKRVHNHPDYYFIQEDSLSDREFYDVISGADTFIGPDSVGIHAATGLGVKNIFGIYAEHVPPKTRAYCNTRFLKFAELDQLERQLQIIEEEPIYPEYLKTVEPKHIEVLADPWVKEKTKLLVEERLPDTAKGLDSILSFHSLQKLDWREEVNRYAQALAPGGYLFLYLPHPKMELWKPGGAWNKSEQIIDPLLLVEHLKMNTPLNLIKYRAVPDRFWSYHLIAKKSA